MEFTYLLVFTFCVGIILFIVIQNCPKNNTVKRAQIM